MYTPPKFRIEDPEQIHSFIKGNSFGLVLSVNGDEIEDTHTPFVLSDDGLLLGHIAKANPQWKGWENGSRVKVIFTGPHAYISPSYYVSVFAVPTWNYTAVSVVGRINVIRDEDSVLGFLDALVADNEDSDSPWALDRNDERYMNLISSIVVFSISMDRVEVSFKLNQNKTEEDQSKVIRSLEATGCPFNSGVASLMAQNIRNAEQGAP
ncbi:MAG: FMN-binding negative transcriptional regulator [Verrucomicrobiota bacterium]